MKIKNKNLKKKKKKKFIFFFGQEIKIRKNPDKTGKNRKSSQKSFIFERFSLTHSGGSSVSLGTIINSSRTNPRFGPSFK